MKVSCYIDDKKVFDLEWDSMPTTSMGFYHEKKEYKIIDIKDSKITIKLVKPVGKKK